MLSSDYHFTRFLTRNNQLGNYLGALSNWVKLQNDAAPTDELFFSIVGWHALTLPQDPKALLASRTDMLAALLAIGIDPKRSVLFHQDHVGIWPDKLRRLLMCDPRIQFTLNSRGF
jgi:tryptophanyl-tRNA synthetase